MIIERAKSETDNESTGKCWPKTNAEAEKGCVTAPQPLTRSVIDAMPLTPMYAILEQHGDQSGKIRLVGDFRAPGINSILTTQDTSMPEMRTRFSHG